MIRVVCPSDLEELQNIVTAAFERSCGLGSVKSISYPELIGVETADLLSNSKYSILVLVSPPESYAPFLISILESAMVKVIVFGEIPPLLAHFLNMEVRSISAKIVLASECSPASTHQFSESAGYIKYIKGLNEGGQVLPSRALLRYDYSNEWNNLGYGAITSDGSAWSLCHCADVLQKNILAYLMNDVEELSAYCALWDYPNASLLWFNRAVGPIDSFEWRLVESYLANYRFDELPSVPILLEIPYGYDSASTMRLDCDEDIESARPLWENYCDWGIPFSLALHASVLSDERQHCLPRDILRKKGSILSHTLTHAPNWGGSFEAAYHEGLESANIIERATGIRPRYAVSPFHHTPAYALEGLSAAGYKGCVGGIICNDPDYLFARGGRPPHLDSVFIGHTQQCMLHGDCLLGDGDPMRVYKEAFDLAFISKTLFGFLDHPFSNRYQYGWPDEDGRISAHRELINYIWEKNKSHLFLSEEQALDFLGSKASIEVIDDEQGFKIKHPKFNPSCLIGVEFGGKTYPIISVNLRLKSSNLPLNHGSTQ